MIRLTGLALAVAALTLASTAGAATPAGAVSKKSPADCATLAVAKPESDGAGVAKPAQPTTAAPSASRADDRQLAPIVGSGGAKPAEQAHQPAQTACVPA